MLSNAKTVLSSAFRMFGGRNQDAPDMSAVDRETLDKTGFVLFKSALSQKEVQQLRDFACELFDKAPADPSLGDSKYVRTNIFARYPIFKDLFWKPALVEACERLFPEGFVFLPAATICDARYSGWHKDLHGPLKHNFPFARQPDFLATTQITYLQDNCDEYGGGLDVIPGSHLEEDHYAYGDMNNPAGATLGEATYDESRKYTIPTRGGDMIIFDVKLNHKATWPAAAGPVTNQYQSGPPEVEGAPRKFLISWKVMPDSKYVQEYMDYFRLIATKEQDLKYLAESLPQSVLEDARRRKIMIAQ